MLREMQFRCNRRTDRIAAAIPTMLGRPVGLVYLRQLGATGQVQGRIRDLTERFAERLEER